MKAFHPSANYTYQTSLKLLSIEGYFSPIFICREFRLLAGTTRLLPRANSPPPTPLDGMKNLASSAGGADTSSVVARVENPAPESTVLAVVKLESAGAQGLLALLRSGSTIKFVLSNGLLMFLSGLWSSKNFRISSTDFPIFFGFKSVRVRHSGCFARIRNPSALA